MFSRYNNKDGFLSMLKSDLLSNYNTNVNEVGEIGNWVDSDKLNEYKRELKFYEKSGGYSKLNLVKKELYDSMINYFNNLEKG
jgi:hypothetical protein